MGNCACIQHNSQNKSLKFAAENSKTKDQLPEPKRKVITIQVEEVKESGSKGANCEKTKTDELTTVKQDASEPTNGKQEPGEKQLKIENPTQVEEEEPGSTILSPIPVETSILLEAGDIETFRMKLAGVASRPNPFARGKIEIGLAPPTVSERGDADPSPAVDVPPPAQDEVVQNQAEEEPKPIIIDDEVIKKEEGAADAGAVVEEPQEADGEANQPEVAEVQPEVVQVSAVEIVEVELIGGQDAETEAIGAEGGKEESVQEAKPEGSFVVVDLDSVLGVKYK